VPLEDRLACVARRVARGEGRRATFSVTCLDAEDMRRLHRRWFGRRRLTDVIAWGLPQPDGSVVGDIYVCPDVARAHARALDIAPSEELLRVAVHGALHALGYDHPSGERRTRSPMWRRQERYVQSFGGRLR
jgi:probable rRNA maturation factor